MFPSTDPPTTIPRVRVFPRIFPVSPTTTQSAWTSPSTIPSMRIVPFTLTFPAMRVSFPTIVSSFCESFSEHGHLLARNPAGSA